MKIILVNTFFGTGGERWAPLGLASMSAVLKKLGNRVCIFDFKAQMNRNGNLLSKSLDNFRLLVSEFEPDIIGMNTSSMNIHFVKYLFEEVISGENIVKIAGGHHGSAFPELTLKKIGNCDIAVFGEGENTISEIASGIPYEKISGIAYNQDNVIMKNEPSIPVKLDDLPFPDYSALDMEFYTRPNRATVKGFYGSCVNVSTSRGCPMRCQFCAENIPVGHSFRSNSAEYVTELISHLYEKYRMKGVYFSDPDFLTNESRALKIFEKFIETGISKKIKWGMQTRSERINEEILNLAVKAGCESIELGVENFSRNKLDFLGKKIPVETNEEAIKLCARKNINVHAYVITGIKDETLDDMDRMLVKIKELGVTSITFSMLRVFPGTTLYEKYGNGFFENNEWNECEVKNFYAKDRFSEISEIDRENWMKSRYLPAVRSIYRRRIYDKYGIKGVFGYLHEKFMGKMNKL